RANASCSNSLLCRAADKVNQTAGDVLGSEGGSVTIYCNYETSTSNAYYLFWYIQYPNEAPKYMLRRGSHDKGAVVNKRVDLELSSTEVTDSAVYYCALRPTVTGNSLTLEIWGTGGLLTMVVVNDYIY
uniref:Ig-like domain-containing protein n=1 Tax=Paramormyrops kingsleyae TaxID=1676925 RepID=A0A3B3Q434_9TELE